MMAHQSAATAGTTRRRSGTSQSAKRNGTRSAETIRASGRDMPRQQAGHTTASDKCADRFKKVLQRRSHPHRTLVRCQPKAIAKASRTEHISKSPRGNNDPDRTLAARHPHSGLCGKAVLSRPHRMHSPAGFMALANSGKRSGIARRSSEKPLATSVSITPVSLFPSSISRTSFDLLRLRHCAF